MSEVAFELRVPQKRTFTRVLEPYLKCGGLFVTHQTGFQNVSEALRRSAAKSCKQIRNAARKHSLNSQATASALFRVFIPARGSQVLEQSAPTQDALSFVRRTVRSG